MPNQRRGFQYAKPFWVPSLNDAAYGQSLERLVFACNVEDRAERYDESWLQSLLHRFPWSLPVAELEPGIGALIPVGREVPTPAGRIDNLFVTQEGNIVLVECKLWRNPEARRSVISQIIDYAQSIARWRYDDLDSAIRRSIDGDGKPCGKSLLEILREALGGTDEVDEGTFVDAVQRNLRMGRVLLMVAGDGIREDTESLADYLQMHAGFHFTLGLVEVAVFRLPDHGLIIQPRIVARTLNIERAIVRLANDSLTADPLLAQPQPSTNTRAMSMTEEIFFEKLDMAAPETAKALRHFLELSAESGVFLDPATKSAALKWESANGKIFNLGSVNLQGQLVSYAVCWVPSETGHVDLAHDYLAGLSQIIGGSVRKTNNPGQWYVVRSGTTLPPATDILSKAEDWLALIRSYQIGLNQSPQPRS